MQLWASDAPFSPHRPLHLTAVAIVAGQSPKIDSCIVEDSTDLSHRTWRSQAHWEAASLLARFHSIVLEGTVHAARGGEPSSHRDWWISGSSRPTWPTRAGSRSQSFTKKPCLKNLKEKKNSRHAHWYNSGCKRESNQPLLILFKSPYTKWNPYLLLKELTVIMLLSRNSIKLSPNDLLFYLYINIPVNSHCRNVCL